MKKITTTTLMVLAIALFSSCESKSKSSAQTEKKETAKVKPNVKLYVLDGGSILVNKLEVFSQDTTYSGQTKQLIDPYYVIAHPKGNLIWDAGLPESFVGQKPYINPNGAFTSSRKDSLKNQLASIGFKISDFKYIALSHAHFDHVGHANNFKNATWLVQENEYNFITNDSAKVKSADIYNLIKELTNIKKLNGDFDVFDDGTVIIKTMPGHTIGHQTLYVEAGLDHPILLTGDLYHFEENRERKGVPSFNYDVEQTLKSMTSFETFAKENNAEIIIQHSQKDYDRLQNLLKE